MADDWGARLATDCCIAYVCSLIKKTLHHFTQFSKNQTAKQKKRKIKEVYHKYSWVMFNGHEKHVKNKVALLIVPIVR